MTAINATSANIALPSIGLDLRFSEASLVWVIDAYMIAFGGCMLLGGRLGDLYGRRRVFLSAVAFFTAASACCGLAMSPGQLVAARCGQGLAAAAILSVALSQISARFTELRDKSKALGIYVFASVGGGGIGLLVGGLLTSAFGWRWIFMINIPIGICVLLLGLTLLPGDRPAVRHGHLDVAGAVTIMASLMLAAYAIVDARRQGWASAQTIGLLVGACALILVFVRIEQRAPAPLIPLQLFRIRELAVANVAGALLASVVLGWNFVSSLYLQLVLQLSPLQVGLVFLPGSLALAGMSLFVSPALVGRYDIRRPLVAGMLLVGVGLALLARAPASASVALEVLPAMLLVGIGAGAAYNPMLVGALSGVSIRSSGAASGVVNTSFTMGGTLGLSILAGVAAMRSDDLLASGAEIRFALWSGYRLAFEVGATSAILAAAVCALLLGRQPSRRNDIGASKTDGGVCGDSHS